MHKLGKLQNGEQRHGMQPTSYCLASCRNRAASLVGRTLLSALAAMLGDLQRLRGDHQSTRPVMLSMCRCKASTRCLMSMRGDQMALVAPK